MWRQREIAGIDARDEFVAQPVEGGVIEPLECSKSRCVEVNGCLVSALVLGGHDVEVRSNMILARGPDRDRAGTWDRATPASWTVRLLAD